MTKRDTGDLFQVIFNAVPLPLFRVSREIEILDLNRAAQKIFEATPALALNKRSGDVMRCLNALGVPEGCGHAKPCVDCRIRNSVREVFATGQEISRRRSTAEILSGDRETWLDLLITVTPIHFGGEMSALLCLEDISELTSLRAMVPICSSCKKIRDDQQLWSSVEHYFTRFLGVDFTHGICPDCAQRLYPEFYKKCKH
jgi:PAS domain-containing protein